MKQALQGRILLFIKENTRKATNKINFISGCSSNQLIKKFSHTLLKKEIVFRLVNKLEKESLIKLLRKDEWVFL